MIYQWKNTIYQKINPQAAGEFLESVNEKYGGIVPKVVVNESRPDEAILHDCFEWEDGIAAELYREEQARAVIRHIVIVPAPPPVEQKINACIKTTTELPSQPELKEPIRAFVHVKPGNNKPQYKPIQDVMADEELKTQMLVSALKDLESFRKKYHELVQLTKVFQAIDELIIKED